MTAPSVVDTASGERDDGDGVPNLRDTHPMDSHPGSKPCGPGCTPVRSSTVTGRIDPEDGVACFPAGRTS